MPTAELTRKPGPRVSPTTVLDLRELHKTLKQIPLLNRPTIRPQAGFEAASASASASASALASAAPDDEGSPRSWSRSRTMTKSKSKSKSKSHSLRREQAIKVPDRASNLTADRPMGQQTTPLAPLQQADRTPETTRARDVLDKSKHRRPLKLRSELELELERDRYPFCLVWAPMPVVSWFMPLVGHTGISNSTGVIYDFSDDFKVSVDNFSFGSPTKYYQFDPAEIPHPNKSTVWDVAIGEVSDQYAKMRHTFCFNNCHQHVAAVLNKVKYARATDWTQTDVCRLITFYSSYNGFLGFLRQWWPTIVIVLALIVFACLSFL